MRVGLLGAGAIAESFHLPAWHKIPGVRVVSICDKDRAKARMLAAGCQANDYGNLRKMLELESLDILDICTPNQLHYKHAKAALHAGLHTIVEKPFVTSEKQAKELLALAKEKKKKLMCAQHARFRGDSLKVKEIINQGKLGKIYFIRAQSLQTRYEGSANESYVNSKLSGGGPLQDFGAHLIDMACWFSGFRNPRYINGNAFSHLLRRESHRGVGADVEDLFVGTVRFDDGSVLSIETSFMLNAPQDLMKIEVFGDEGSLSWPDLVYTRRNRSGVSCRKLSQKRVKPASVAELQEFIDCIRDNSEPCVKPAETKQVVSIIEKLYKSAAKGVPIRC